MTLNLNNVNDEVGKSDEKQQMSTLHAQELLPWDPAEKQAVHSGIDSLVLIPSNKNAHLLLITRWHFFSLESVSVCLQGLLAVLLAAQATIENSAETSMPCANVANSVDISVTSGTACCSADSTGHHGKQCSNFHAMY